MPNRPVEETFFLKEYRVGERYAEAIFDRHYKSSMINSPDHLIFITALIHTQKLIYATLCHEFNLDYNPNENEIMKIWGTKVEVSMCKLITKQKDLLQKLFINQIEELSRGTYQIKLNTSVEDLLDIKVDAHVYLL